MPILSSLLVLSFVPAILAWAMIPVLRRLLPRELADRYAIGLAFGLAFLVGFQIPEQFGTWIPQRHWHWLLWLVPGSALMGGIRLAPRLHNVERNAILFAAAIIAGVCLVPTWPDLRPSPIFWRIYLSISFFGQTWLLDRILCRLVPKPFSQVDSSREHVASCSSGNPPNTAMRVSAILLGMIITAFVVTGLIAVCVSISYARIALAASAALIGCWAASIRSPVGVDLRQLLLPYFVAIGGMAYIGCIEPRNMIWGLLVAPWAPLAAGLARFVSDAVQVSHSRRRLATAGIGFVLGAAIAISWWNLHPPTPQFPPQSDPAEEDLPF